MSKSLFKSTSIVSIMTFISRILGFVRDLIVAQIFGATAEVDAFYIAFKIPNFMRNMFAEGAFSQSFVPILSSYRKSRSIEETHTFIARMAGALVSVLIVVTLLGMVFSKEVVGIFAPGLDAYRFHLACKMLSITFPYLILISLSAFVGAILNSYGRFAIPSLTPVFLNICLIATAFGITNYFTIPIEAQAWGVFFAGFVQLFFQLPFLKKIGFTLRPQFDLRDQGVRNVLKLMLPALFGVSVGQISILLNTIFASFLAIGSVSWLYYSERVAYFPLGVFGVALSTVILPSLSRHHSSGSKEKFENTLDWGLRCNFLIGMPASLAMIILSGPLVVSLFSYGNFSVYDVYMTQRSVIAYAVGLQAFMIVKMFSSAFYSRRDIITPVKITAVSLLINMILSALLIFPLAHAGLALASSCASWISVAFMWRKLRQLGFCKSLFGSNNFLSQLLFSNGILAYFLWSASPSVPIWLAWSWSVRLIYILILGLFAILVYILSLRLCNMKLGELKSVAFE